MSEITTCETHLQLLINISSKLSNEESHDGYLRAFNFMSYELATLCDHQSDNEVLETLNNFFFTNKKFKLSPSPILLKSILTERAGCGIALAFMYMHLAKCIGLELQLIHWPLHAILKWERGGKSDFIDLEQQGRRLSEDELLTMVNKHKEQVRTLSLNESIVQYLAYISTHYRQLSENELLHKTLGLILKIEPENTRYLAERALLRRKMGLGKEALSDLKRYFSFTDRDLAPQSLIHAYDELVSALI